MAKRQVVEGPRTVEVRGVPVDLEVIDLLAAALDAVEETIVVCAAVRDAGGAYVGARIRYANRHARDRWLGPGTSYDAIAGLDLYEVTSHGGILREVHERVIATGEPFAGMILVPHPGGRRVLDLHVVRLDDGFVATSRDVTDERAAEEALRESEADARAALARSEERFREALDATLDTLAILQAVRSPAGEVLDFEIVYANRAWRAVYGRPDVDPVGQHLYADYPFFRPRKELHVRTVETGEPLRRTLEVEGPPRAWYEFQLTKFGDGYVTASRNVTDRVLTEAALSASEERLMSVITGVDAIVTLEDQRTGDSYVSPQAERILGFAPEQLAALDFWKSRVVPEDAAWVLPIWDNETDEYELEYRMRAADERIVWLRERVVHQIDRDRGIDRWFGLAFDITEQKLLESRLETARRMESLGRLASGVAHDFNNLLYGISILAGYLVRGSPDGPLRDDAGRILEAVDRGSALTRQLLAFARGGDGVPEPTNVATVVAGVASMLELLFGGSISLETEAAAPGATVRVDRHRLEEALVNLATNARDAMPGGGRLRMRTDEVTVEGTFAVSLDVEPGRYVRIDVEDSGIGIAPEIAPRIFEPFATTKPVEAGTGLGLSNVYSFVRAAGGSIGFDSRPEEGTTFTIHLPSSD